MVFGIYRDTHWADGRIYIGARGIDPIFERFADVLGVRADSALIFTSASRYSFDCCNGLGWGAIVFGFVDVAVIAFGSGRSRVYQRCPLASPVCKWHLHLLCVSKDSLSAIPAHRYDRLFHTWFGTLPIRWFCAGLARQMTHVAWLDTLTLVYIGIFPAVAEYDAWGYCMVRRASGRCVQLTVSGGISDSRGLDLDSGGSGSDRCSFRAPGDGRGHRDQCWSIPTIRRKGAKKDPHGFHSVRYYDAVSLFRDTTLRRRRESNTRSPLVFGP